MIVRTATATTTSEIVKADSDAPPPSAPFGTFAGSNACRTFHLLSKPHIISFYLTRVLQDYALDQEAPRERCPTRGTYMCGARATRSWMRERATRQSGKSLKC